MSYCQKSSELNIQWRLKGSVFTGTLLKTHLRCFHSCPHERYCINRSSSNLSVSGFVCVCVCVAVCVHACMREWIQMPLHQCWNHLTIGMKQRQVLGSTLLESTLRNDWSDDWKYHNRAYCVPNLGSALLKMKPKWADVAFSSLFSQINYYWSCSATVIIIKKNPHMSKWVHFSVITQNYTWCVWLKKQTKLAQNKLWKK